MFQTNTASKGLQALLILASMPALIFSAPVTWEGTSSMDLNNPSNWSSSSVPGTVDDAIFDSTISGINLTPTDASNFSVGTFNFPNSASAFDFTFSNCSLSFNNGGITGSQTNTTIAVNNVNNSSSLTGNQIDFTGTSSSGSAALIATNSGTSTSGSMSVLNAGQIYSLNPLSMLSGGSLTATNTGVDNSATSSDQIAYVNGPQIACGNQFNLVAPDNTTITIINSGTNTSSGSSNQVGIVTGQQFFVFKGFQANNFLNFSAMNLGSDIATGTGANIAGFINSNQVEFDYTFTVADNATLAISNSGNNTGSSNSYTGYVSSNQGYFTSPFQAGKLLTLTASNMGTDSSPGTGSNNVGYVANAQLLFTDMFTSGDNAALNATNTGTNSSSGNGCNTSYVGTTQLAAMLAFQTGSNATLTTTNSGTNSASGTANSIGSVGTNQMQFGSTFNAVNNTTFVVSNTGINSGSGINNNSGVIGSSQIDLASSFQTGNLLNFSVTNMGTDSSTGTGGNNVGTVANNQIELDMTLICSDNATFTFSNTGTNNSSGASSSIGYIGGLQSLFAAPFTAGNYLSMTATNTGTDSGTGTGSNNVGSGGDEQFDFGDIFTSLDNTSITAINRGNNSSTGNGNTVGSVHKEQFVAQGSFQVGNNALLSATNTGIISSSGTGHYTGIVGNAQMEFGDSFTSLDNTTFLVTSSGSDNGSGNTNNTGSIGSQVSFGMTFQAGNSLNFTATNSGTESGTGTGSDNTGYVSGSQISAAGAFQTGNYATLTVSNSGTSSNGNVNAVGFVTTNQILLSSTFNTTSPANNTSIVVSNTGTATLAATGSTIGNVGVSQVQMMGAFGNASSDYLNIQVSNTGTESTTSSGNNYTGTVIGQQLELDGIFTTQDNAIIKITNSGTTTGSGNGSAVGYVEGNQFYTTAAVSLNDNAAITISNTGINTGTGTNDVAYVNTLQFNGAGSFQAGNSFTLNVSNSGQENGSGASSNNLAYINGAQFDTGGGFVVGDNATISISNSGTNTNGSSTGQIGFISGNQINAAGAFQAGKNLILTATNSGDSVGGSAVVGKCNYQMFFDGNCTFDDGSTLIAANNGTGTVNGAQIWFNNGLTLTSGKATIQATNSPQGTVNSDSIVVEGTSVGGDINFILGNASLYIDVSSPSFTIGQLNGDETSTVNCGNTLIISTDSGVNGIFTGAVLSTASLLKAGPGSQQLTGANAYAAMTTVQEGTLVLNGNLGGNILIDPSGTLKGNANVGANSITNNGVIAPGQSIGTISGGTFTSTGNYDVQVNGAGQSSLIDVTGAADITGGEVVVSSADGTYGFQHRYTIVDAGSLTGSLFSGATAVSSLIQPTLSYDPTHVYLFLVSDIASAAATPNQLAVANQLDSIVSPTPLQSSLISEIASLSVSGAQAALDSVSGWQYTNDIWLAESVNEQFIRRLYDPLRCINTKNPECGCCCNPCEHDKKVCCDKYTVWSEVGWTHTNLNGNGNSHSLNLNGWQATAGIQKTFSCNWTLGAAGSYEHDYTKYGRHGGSVRSDTGMAALYGLYRHPRFYALADLAYGYSSNKMFRSVNVGDQHYTGHSRPKISQFTFYGELGVDWRAGYFLIQPFAGITAGEYWRNHVKEGDAGGWQLNVHGKDHALYFSRLGVHIMADKIPHQVSISVDAAWDKRLNGGTTTTVEQFQEFGTCFDIKGVPLNSNSFDCALTIAKCIDKNWRFYVKGAGKVWNHAYECNALAGAEYSW